MESVRPGRESDGVPKTPEWAKAECRIPARDIEALAREWGSKKTMLASGGLGGWGGACRSATGNEWARTMIALAAMQGMGKPGSNIWGTSQGCPSDESFLFPGYAEGGIGCDVNKSAACTAGSTRCSPTVGAITSPHDSTEGQGIPRIRIPEALQHEEFEWRGKGFSGASIESQLQKYEYPAPGYPKMRMYWRYGGSFFGTMTQTNRYVKSYRNPKLEFAVSQPIWLEGEAKFADIILPACTNFERWDISEFASCSGYIPDSYTQTNNRVITFQKKCIEPLGESKSDYDIFAAVCERLGVGDDLHHGGEGRIRVDEGLFPRHRPAQAHNLGRVREEGLFRRPVPEGPQVDPGPALVRRRPRCATRRTGACPWDTVGLKGLQTNSGKIEFVANSLTRMEKQGVRGCRAAGHGSAVHPQLGRPSHRRPVRQVPAADGLPAPALQLPHHG